MKTYKGVVFFDYDFTLMDKTQQILTATPRTVESVEQLKANGYLTMLCSGRSKRFLENDIDHFDGAITCNGAFAEVNQRVIRDEYMSEELIEEVLRTYLPEEVSIHLETQRATYYVYRHRESYEAFRNFLEFPDHWFAPWKERSPEDHITKIVIYYQDIAVFHDFQKRYSDIFQSVRPFENESIFDITLKGITKGDAIRQLMDQYEIKRENSYAFGDSDNDIEMLNAVGTPIVMANHSVKAGEAAAMITGSVKDEGVTQALKKLGLI